MNDLIVCSTLKVYSFLIIFIDELQRNNPLSRSLIHQLLHDILSSFGFITLPASILFGILATFFLLRQDKSIIWTYLAEAFALLMAVSPILFPFKAMRFGFGLYLFSSFLAIHARTVNTNRKEPLKSKVNQGEEDSKEEEELKRRRNSFFGALIQQSYRTFGANLSPRLEHARGKLPSINRISYSLAEMLLIDACLYLMQEFIPLHIRQSNQRIAIALVGGVWVLLAMDFFYSNFIIVLEVMGLPIPLYMRHRHPLLSTSLAEFWGVRWNPIISRLLQDAFYKPLRSIGTPRILCVIGCFTGSACLHAWPQFMSTYSLPDSLMMFSFFFGQGFLLTVELLVTYAFTPLQDSAHMVKGGSEYTAANYQWLVELTIVVLILSGCYLASESTLPFEINLIIYACLLMSAFTCVLLFHLEVEGKSLLYSPARMLRIIIGWLWAVGSVIGMLPLFSIPVYNALGAMYDRSYFVGPLIRAASRSWGRELEV